MMLTGDYTLTSQTAAQKAFNVPTNGAFNTTANRSYRFRCFLDITTMSASSGTFGFALGGTANITSQKWMAHSQKSGAINATNGIGTQAFSYNDAANTTLTSNTTTTTGSTVIEGIVRCTTAGTLIPQISLTVAAAAVIKANSFFEIWDIGTNTDTNTPAGVFT